MRPTTPLEGQGTFMAAETVNVRYMVDDVEAVIAWYTTHLGVLVRLRAADLGEHLVKISTNAYWG
jgi:hypothetical protein